MRLFYKHTFDEPFLSEKFYNFYYLHTFIIVLIFVLFWFNSYKIIRSTVKAGVGIRLSSAKLPNICIGTLIHEIFYSALRRDKKN